MLSFIINNKVIKTDLNPGMVLLDFIRGEQKLTGTKEACREGECGACTVLVGELQKDNSIIYKSCASCLLPIGEIDNCHIVTVEGLNFSENEFNAIQNAIIENGASQCGYCTPGIILSLSGFCLTSENFSYEDATTALDGNICRCTGYSSIKNAAKTIVKLLEKKDNSKSNRVNVLVENNILPKYFLNIPEQLKTLSKNQKDKFEKGKTLVAGGTDLFVQQPDELIEKNLFFLSQRKDLNYIKEENNNICVGGSITISEFKDSEIIKKYFPNLQNDLLLHSSTILRNKATLTGNIVNASPIGDITIILLVLNTNLILEKNGKTRNVLLSDFYKGYKTMDLNQEELISELQIPIPEKNNLFNFEKVSNRKILDIAAVNSAINLNLDDSNNIKKLSISAGGIAATPLLIKSIDKFLNKKLTNELIQNVAEEVFNSVSPIDDIRGSAKYKKLLIKQLIIAHFKTFINNGLNLEEK